MHAAPTKATRVSRRSHFVDAQQARSSHGRVSHQWKQRVPAGSPNRAFTRRHHSVILNDVAVEPYIVRVLIHEKPGVDPFCGY